MRCDQIELRLDAFIDGELPAGEIRVLKSHMESCPSCGRELEARRELRRAFADRPRPSAPPGLRDSILAAVGADPSGERTMSGSGGGAVPRRRARWQLALAAAAVLVLMFVIPLIGERETNDGRPAPFTTPSRVVVPRFGESAEEGARVEFGGIDLGSGNQRRSR